MTDELVPLKNKCNIECDYCYQKFMREEETEESYDVEKMLSRTRGEFILFGGEPLLVPLEDLEKFFKFGYEKYKKNGIQTNGTLITDRHIALFNLYAVHVGISIDGPEYCNDSRRVGTLENTRKSTLRTINAIKALCESGNVPSLIVTLHKMNASSERLPILLQWFKDLGLLGIKNVRIHFLENDDCNPIVLSEDELFTAITSIMELDCGINFDLYEEMFKLLTEEKPNVSCTWNSCDPYTTPAVHGIGPQGELHNCGRTNKDGHDYIKSTRSGNERALALYFTPQEFQGCKGCRFFFACKGHCPGESKDWRNRTEHCNVIKRIFTYLEERIIRNGGKPLSLSNKLKKLEFEVLNVPGAFYKHGDEHGDAWFLGEVEVRTPRLRIA